MVSDEKLAELVKQIRASSPTLKRLRFHTRMPVTLPARITDTLLNAIQAEGLRTFVVTHFNHPKEVTAEAKQGITKLLQKGITVLNQTVLLKGVNDQAETLRALFLALGNEGVLPYYLHHCDWVAGAEHFRTSIVEGRKLWTELRGTLPGYLIPEYVLDTPGGWGKIPIGAGFVAEAGDGSGEYTLARGGRYQDPQSP
jgi:lysine 2,3-aminomutase